MKKKLIYISLLFILSSCSTAYDVSLNKDYMAHETLHDTNQKDTIAAQAAAISSLKIVTNLGDDPRDKAMAAMSNIMLAGEIASLKYHSSKTRPPRLNTENVEPLTDVTLGVAPYVVVGKVVSDTADEIGDETYSSDGGDLTVEKIESHTTTAGDENSVSSTFTHDSTKTSETKDPELMETE